ncbi:MAG: EAL domain-containing protein [Pseudomonadota bacterium]
MTDNTQLPLSVMEKVFERNRDAVAIVDHEHKIIAVNPAFIQLTGYSAEESCGKSLAFFTSASINDAEQAAMCRTVLTTGIWENEVWGRRKDGGVYPKWMTISSVLDAEVRISHYIVALSHVSEHGHAVERMRHLAHHDSLTQLLNRTAMESQLRRTLASARREGRQVAVVLLDMDNFKTINDTLGHHIGDGLLISVAKRLIDHVRASDVVARFGGDEFVVVLSDIENPNSVAGLISKLKRGLGDHYEVGGHSLYSTPSIGVSLFPIDGTDPETLLKNADTAMYHAKSKGRDNYQFFSQDMNHAAAERLELENAFRQALEGLHSPNSQFSLYFQPQFHVQTRRIVGLEALTRWSHPTRGAITASQFVSIAEETGLIQPLGDWVFWESCRHLRQFRDQGIDGVRMTINLSAQQLRNEALPSVIRGALTCYDLQASDLEIDITENTAMQNPTATIAILSQLKTMGIALAIDDFGSGYSSLAQIKHLPVHRLKLDRSFIAHVEHNKEDAAVCAAAILLGHNLGLDLVAEGVETQGQQDCLSKLGCDILQGFFYSPPLPADAVVSFLKTWVPS